MKKLYKGLVIFAMAVLILAPFALVNAQVDLGLDVVEQSAIGDFGNEDPRVIAANIIGIALGFLGILAVIIILLGGFKWMTAAGNDDQVGEAKKIIVAGIIGLAIILASWGIANFVINSLLTATGGA